MDYLGQLIEEKCEAKLWTPMTTSRGGHAFSLGMAMGRVWAGFLNTRTQPANLSQKPEPTLFNKRVFFCALDSPYRAPQAPWAQSKIRNPKKKKKKPPRRQEHVH